MSPCLPANAFRAGMLASSLEGIMRRRGGIAWWKCVLPASQQQLQWFHCVRQELQHMHVHMPRTYSSPWRIMPAEKLARPWYFFWYVSCMFGMWVTRGKEMYVSCMFGMWVTRGKEMDVSCMFVWYVSYPVKKCMFHACLVCELPAVKKWSRIQGSAWY